MQSHLFGFLAGDKADAMNEAVATVAATRGAIRSARSKRLEQSEAVAPEVARLEKVADELKEIQEKLKELKRGN